MTHMQQQRAQASVLGPDLVLVRTWCWHEWHVRSTWHQQSGNIVKHSQYNTKLHLRDFRWAVWGPPVGWRLLEVLCEQAQHLKHKWVVFITGGLTFDVELTHAGSRLAGGLPPQSRIPSCWRSPRRSCRTRGWTSARPGARRPASSLSRQVLTTMVRVDDICLTHFIPVTTTPTTIMTHTIDHCIHPQL